MSNRIDIASNLSMKVLALERENMELQRDLFRAIDTLENARIRLDRFATQFSDHVTSVMVKDIRALQSELLAKRRGKT